MSHVHGFLPRRGLAVTLAACAVVVALAGCDKKEGGSTQVVAKVNDGEITVHQLNFLLQQQRNLKPEQAEAATRQALERLVDQELAVQRATKDKLDHDPRVLQALDAARREVLTRAYIESVADRAPKPTAEDIQKYFDSKPGNFAQRRIFNVQKVDINVERERAADIASHVQAAHGAGEVVDYLKAQNLRYNVSQSQQPAESLGPLLDRVAALKDGQSMAVPQPFGLTALTVVGTQPAPVTLEQAKAQIEQQLLADRKRDAVVAEGKALRDAAKIEYLGRFAPGAASAPATPTGVSATAPVASSPAAAGSGIDSATLQKGLGIK